MEEQVEVIEEPVIPLTIFEAIKQSIFERAQDGIVADANEVLYAEFFDIMNDNDSNTLIKKRRRVEQFLKDHKIPDLTTFSTQFNTYSTRLNDFTAILNNNFLNTMRRIDKKKDAGVTVGILEVMLKSKIENDLRKSDETSDTNNE